MKVGVRTYLIVCVTNSNYSPEVRTVFNSIQAINIICKSRE